MSWVDLGAGDGENVTRLTQGVELQGKHAVDVYRAAIPERLSHAGWTVHDTDIVKWLDQGHVQADGASLLDVVEHFDRPDAEALLTRVETLHRFVVISTPLGFMPHDGSIYPSLVEQPLQWHRSGFTPKEFERRGYVVMAWPSYHESPDGRTYGAILACRDRNAGAREMARYRDTMLQAYRKAKSSYRLSGGRLLARRALFAVAGVRGVEAAGRVRRLLHRS